MLFITVQPDGTIEEVEVAKGESYEALRKGVQGWIEPMDHAEDLTHYHNEEFLYAEGEVFGQVNLTVAVLSNARVYGPVVFTGGIDSEGDTCGLSEDWAKKLRTTTQYVRDNLERLLAHPEVAEANTKRPEPSFTITAL